MTIQEAQHQIITGYQVHDRRPADRTLWTPRSITTSRSLDGHRISRRPIGVSRRRPMRTRPSPGACGGSSCRTRVEKRPRGARTSDNDGFAVVRAGASDRKAGSVCSNGGMDYGAVAIAARRHGAVGRPRRHREQSGEHREVLERVGHRIAEWVKWNDWTPGRPPDGRRADLCAVISSPESSLAGSSSSALPFRLWRRAIIASCWGIGAGDGDRTRDIELGKLAFYR
jgi:hypothetical protein